VREAPPFCLVIALVEPHVPWVMGDVSQYPPKKINLPLNIADTPRTRENFGRYLAEITYMDGQVGELLRMLDESGKADDTLVLFTSEQGAQFPGCKWTNWDTGLHTVMNNSYWGTTFLEGSVNTCYGAQAMNHSQDRCSREFTKTTLLASSALSLSNPGRVFGNESRNRRIKTGVIGCGSVSRAYLPTLLECPDRMFGHWPRITGHTGTRPAHPGNHRGRTPIPSNRSTDCLDVDVQVAGYHGVTCHPPD